MEVFLDRQYEFQDGIANFDRGNAFLMLVNCDQDRERLRGHRLPTVSAHGSIKSTGKLAFPNGGEVEMLAWILMHFRGDSGSSRSTN